MTKILLGRGAGIDQRTKVVRENIRSLAVNIVVR